MKVFAATRVYLVGEGELHTLASQLENHPKLPPRGAIDIICCDIGNDVKEVNEAECTHHSDEGVSVGEEVEGT